MRTRRTTWRARIALAAAWLFLVQSLAGSFALAAGTGLVPLDAFGNPLCITSIDHDLPIPDGDHDKLPSCCALGCSLSASALATPPDSVWLAVRFPVVVRETRHSAPEILALADEHDPGSPRAPPGLG